MGKYKHIIRLMVCLFWLCGLPLSVGATEDGKDLFYSVHIDSAGNIEEVNRKINQIRVREKIVFWERRDVKGMGTYYKVYLGWFDEFKPARRFMRKLQEAGWKRAMAVHWFKDPPWQPKQPAAGEDTKSLQQPAATAAPVRQPPMADRFTDNGDGTVTDRKTGLMWIKNGWRIDFFSAVTWEKAVAQCANFRGGNYTDWRLPTLAEWKSLVDRTVSYPALVDPNPFTNIITHMPYWSGTEYAYGGKRLKSVAGARDSYTVMLYSGTFNHQPKDELAFILPVRNLSK
jgi:hypothetical protein